MTGYFLRQMEQRKELEESLFSDEKMTVDPEDLDRAKGLFRWSILYMFGICLLLLISRTQLSVEFEQQSLQIYFSLLSNLSN